MELVIAEKPSVARDIARVLGANQRAEGCLRGPQHVVTWCIGHLVELEEPGAYSEAWKKWSLDALPMLPETFRLKPSRSSYAQWKIVRELLRSREFSGVINACDAGREGELIFRYCYELAGARLPIRRLWISSMTDSALRSGFASLRDGRQYEPLADAARCRAEADWIVGMNATRAVTTRTRQQSGGALFSIGRVQTPTLALVVERERTITRFVPRDYWEVLGQFTTPHGTFQATYAHLGQRRLGALALARDLVARLAACQGPTGPRVESLERKTERQPPPQLFDLTSLQRTANKRFGLSAQRTLDIAQALYESHKLITYPRTDSRHLSTDLRNELPAIFRALSSSATYAPFASTLLATPPGPTPRVFNNGRVTDHHAIIPTSKAPPATLDRDEQRIHDLIVRRFLGAFFPDAEFALTHVTLLVGHDAPLPPLPDPAPPRDAILEALPPPPDRLFARGKILLSSGWREVAGFDENDDADRGKDGDEEASQRLPPLSQGQHLQGAFHHAQKRTRPPPRYTEASLLSAMEFAGREIEDDALRLALKERGLGTPATRASIIETLIRRGYLERQQKSLVPTALGDALIDLLPARSLASPELTGEWEARLVRMTRGEEPRARFMKDIATYIQEVVAQVRASTPTVVAAAASSGPAIGPCPLCQAPVHEAFKTFSCSRCTFKLWKQLSGKNISPKLAAVLLRTRRTQTLQGFRSKAGKPFQAALEIDSTGHVRLSFDPPGTSLQNPPPPAAPAPAATPAPPRAPAPAAPPPVRKPRAAPRPRAAASPTTKTSPLLCPHCGQGKIVQGKQAWGCSRWREGCKLVIPFRFGEKSLTERHLEELITQGHTSRKATWTLDGAAHKAKLVLDLRSEPPRLAIDSG
jgi:DNA topoisomerase-3